MQDVSPGVRGMDAGFLLTKARGPPRRLADNWSLVR